MKRRIVSSLFCKKTTSAGFTLVELLVVMSMMLVLSSLILIKHNAFRGHLLLRSLAYEVALAIRQAQVYGLGIKEYRGISDPIAAFQIGYGIHFATADPASFFLFADVNGNRTYAAADGDGIIQTFALSGGNSIVGLCAGSDVNVGCGLSTLDIIYERPAPEAYINGTQSNGAATVRLRSAQGEDRLVGAWITGQILVQ